jgi:hypothetical protein
MQGYSTLNFLKLFKTILPWAIQSHYTLSYYR